MTEKPRTYGLLIGHIVDHGTERISARVVSREEGRDHPLGVGNIWSFPKHLAKLYLDGLGMYGFISETNGYSYIGYDPEYRDIYAVDEVIAKRMARTLRKINGVIRKASATEAGDMLVAFAKSLKLSFVVECKGPSRGSSYADNGWYFMSIEDGRNRFRRLIEETAKTVRDRKTPLAS